MLARTIAATVFVMVCSAQAHAFKIGSAVSYPCHEWITLKAFFVEDELKGENSIMPDWAFQDEVAPTDAVWVKVAEYLERQLGHEFESDFERLLAITLFIGVRYPDQANFAITDIGNMRDIHMAEEGQEEHALRALDHDHAAGNAEAIAELRTFLMDTVEEAYESFQTSRPAEGTAISKETIRLQTEPVSFWLEYYGEVKVPVWKPLFLLGKAAHALQDSFAHTYRSEDTTTIYSVGNFVEALSTDYDQARDGPRHSDQIDDCTLKEVQPLQESATLATRQLFLAARDYLKVQPDDVAGQEAKRAQFEQLFDTWLGLDPNCSFADGYCETPWAELASEHETHPLVSCSGSGPSAPPSHVVITLALLGVVVWFSKRWTVS